MDAKSLRYTVPFQLTKTIRRNTYSALSHDNKELSATGKIIVITGGGTGIGAAAASVWAHAGASGIVVAGRRLDKLQEVVANVEDLTRGKTNALAVQTDLTKDKDVENLFAQTIKTFGRAPDVVLANAGKVENVTMGDHSTDDWWHVMEVNLKGLHACAYHFINSQTNPKEPHGTFITTNSGLGGVVVPGVSAYSISKLAGQRYIEYLQKEYPSLRTFTLFPGIVRTSSLDDDFREYAHDDADLTGFLALYLCSPRADYLKGSLASINWDIEEMEAHKDEIVEQRLLDIKWMPILPASGGSGLE